MKKTFFYLAFVILLINCSSIEKRNTLIETNLTIKQQIDDIDFLEKKLVKIQPSLYNFITKEALQKKFDSVRSTIKSEIKPNEFYFKISPLLASIRQGHASISPLTKKFSKKEYKEIKKNGLLPASQFNYKYIDNKLLVIKNKSKDSTIIKGSEVVSIEDITPQEVFLKYRKTFNSDGYNETFIPYANSMRFGTYMYYELGLKDSLTFHFRYKDSLYSKTIKQINKKKKNQDIVKKDTVSSTKSKDSIVKKVTKEEEKLAKEKTRKKNEYDYNYGYNKSEKEFAKTLIFTDVDSTTAVFKIKNFFEGGYKVAYKEVFELLRNKNTQNLVLDLRNNPGGRLDEIHELYSYLTTDSTFQLIEEAKVNSKMSLLKADYLNSMPKISYILTIPSYPIYASIMMIKTRKDKNGDYRYRMKSSKQKPKKEHYFNGKIYVLINGGSFSASCVLSSKLKENKDIIFVGEETGGTFNGTVAGRTSTYELPNSKLKTRLWLMEIAVTNKTEQIGRGIFPDVEISPTIEDVINKNDPELEWIKKDIENKKEKL